MGAVAVFSRGELLRSSTRLAGLGCIGTGLSVLSGCQFLSPKASSTPITVRPPELHRICQLAAQTRIPAMYVVNPTTVTDHGGRMACGPSYESMFRQSADYVDKVLRGTSIADLPVVQLSQFDFVVNVKAAQDLGLVFPADVAAQVTHWVQ
jgi:hypothetical protein